MGRRGRPKKIRLSNDELLESLLLKAYNFCLDKDSNVRLVRNGTPLTLEETAFMIWNIEGRKTKKPLCNMMMIKTERAALDKMRKGLQKYGINSLDDVFEPKFRAAASKYGCTDCPE